MKVSLIILTIIAATCSLAAQTPLDAPAMEQTLTVDEFSDVVKSVWDVIKKGADDYEDVIGLAQ